MEASDKDRVSFEVNEDVLADLNSAIVAIAAGGALAGGIFLAFGAVTLGFAVYS